MQRNSILNNVFTVGGTVAAGTVGLMVQQSAYLAGFFVILILVSLIGLAWFLVDHDSRAASSRLQEIEMYINEKAGERLLCWERDHGLDAVGYGARVNSGINRIRKFIGTLTNFRKTPTQ